jgi:hypothetical protein
MVLGSNPGGGKIFCTHSDQPWGPPSLLYNVYQVSVLGVKQPGCGIDHSTPSSANVKERVELYLYSPSGPLCRVRGWTLLYSYWMTRELKFVSRLERGCFTFLQHLDCVWGPQTPSQGLFLQKYTRWYIQLATAEVKNTWSSSCTSLYVFQVTSHLLYLFKTCFVMSIMLWSTISQTRNI